MSDKLTLMIEDVNDHLEIRYILYPDGRKKKIYRVESPTFKNVSYSWRDLQRRDYRVERSIYDNYKKFYKLLLFMYPTYDFQDMDGNLLHEGKKYDLSSYLKKINKQKPEKIALAVPGGAGHLYFGMSDDDYALTSADEELLGYLFSSGQHDNYLRYFSERLEKASETLKLAKYHATERLLTVTIPKMFEAVERSAQNTLLNADQAMAEYEPLKTREVLYCDILPISGIHRIFISGRGFRGYWDEQEYVNERYSLRDSMFTAQGDEKDGKE